jgi:hypothetical protein
VASLGVSHTSRDLEFPMRHTTLLLSTLLLTTGCSAFYEDTTSRALTTYGFQVRTFDEALPDALEHIFWDCREPLTLSDGQTDLDLLGNCEPWNYPAGSPEQALASLLATQPATLTQPMSLSSVAQSIRPSFELFGVGCAVTITPTVTVSDVSLYDLRSSWTTRNNRPALAIDFDFDDGIQAEVSFVRGPVSCSNRWIASYARSVLDTALSTPVSLAFRTPDLDLWFLFDRGTVTTVDVGTGAEDETGVLVVDVEARMQLGDLSTGTLLDTLPTAVKTAILQTAGFDPEPHAQNIETSVEAALQSTAQGLEAHADAVLDEICSVSRDSQRLQIWTDDDCVSGVHRWGTRTTR